MRKHKKQKHNKNHKNSSKIRPPFFINKNQHFDSVRKQMAMKTDGPTINEMSSIDTTGSLGKEDTPRTTDIRPISASSQIKNWWEDSWKQIIIGLAIAGVSFFLGRLIFDHDNRLTEHDKDIEYLQKNDAKQDENINLLKDKSNELKTDMRLIEQRMDLEKSTQTQQKKKNN